MLCCLFVSYLGIVSLQLSFLQSVTPNERERESSESLSICKHNIFFLHKKKVQVKAVMSNTSVGNGTFLASGQSLSTRPLLAQNIYGLIKVRDRFNIQENELGHHHMTQEGRKSCR